MPDRIKVIYKELLQINKGEKRKNKASSRNIDEENKFSSPPILEKIYNTHQNVDNDYI